MKKLRAFIYVFWKSLTSASYYRDVVKTNFMFSVKYLVVLTLLSTLVITVKEGAKEIPNISREFKVFIESAKNSYPDDLVFSVAGGEWSVNRPEPFIIAMPKGFEPAENGGGADNAGGADNGAENGETANNENPKNLVVFYKDGTIDDLKNLDTMAVINKTNVIYREGDKVSVQPIKNLPNSKVDKAEFSKFISKAESIAGVVGIFLMFFVVIFAFGGSLFAKFFYFLAVGLIVWVINLIASTKLNFKNSTQVAIHASTIPVVIEAIAGVFGVRIPLAMWFVLINILLSVVVLANLSKAKKSVGGKSGGEVSKEGGAKDNRSENTTKENAGKKD